VSDLLTPEEASAIAGVPAQQLRRWAWLRVGPRNSGTRHRPKFHEDDIREWRSVCERQDAALGWRHLGKTE
jgi:hypothetical protein